jgi:3-hydroxyisobutyrate dehydrogenase
MKQKIAFLGLGLMGGYMSANLARHGFPIKGWNRTPNRPGSEFALIAGVEIVPTLELAVNSADIVFICVGDIPDVEQVIFGVGGVREFARPDTLIVDMSTIGTNAARQIGARLKQNNLRFLDAPVSGGDIGAKNGTLTIMVGGEAEDFANCQEALLAMGKTIKFCGPVGSGQAVKMCNQILCALNMVGLCEAIEMAKQQEIDPNLIVEICSTGAAGSWALANLGPKIINADLAPGFAIKHILKDLRIIKETIQAQNGDLPGVDLADSLFKIVQNMDDGKGQEQGTQGMIRAYES